jgi:hypothetical protein
MARSAVSAVALTGADQAVRSGACTYHGFSLRETAGATAVVRIYDGTSAAGTLLDSVALSANESAREYYPVEDSRGGIRAASGIYIDVVSGAVEGSLRVGD